MMVCGKVCPGVVDTGDTGLVSSRQESIFSG